MVVKYERQFSVIAYLIGVILGICGNQIGIEKMFFNYWDSHGSLLMLTW
jgi:hypothetical protein